MRNWVVGMCLGLAATNAFANGGTFDTSAIQRTGNLEPVRQNKIALVEESLHIAFEGEFADVRVDYRLENRGGPTVLSYGFPVDVGSAANANESEALTFAIFDGGREVPVERVLEKESPMGGRKRPWKNYEEDRPVRKWHLVTLKFLPRETKELSVRYRVMNFGQMSGTSNDVFWGQTPREFLYALSPSSAWGDGRVGKFTIVADMRKLRAEAVPTPSVSLPGWTEKDGVYRWDLKDFDLRKAADLKIVYDLGAQFQSEAAQRSLLPRSDIASIRVSSTREPSRTTRATYGAEHLLDGDFSTAWIEGAKGPGVGEWIELRFRPKTKVRYVALANGYWKNAERLAENGWIKKVRLDWEWGDAYKWDGSEKDRKESEVITLKRRPVYDAATARLPYGRADVLQEFGEMGGVYGLRSLRLTILEAEGGRSQDTAVSELFFGADRE